MRTKIALFFVAVACFAVATQQTFSFERKYKVGEKDAYNIKMNIEADFGSIDLNADITQTVTKVFDNSDANIETETTKMKMSMNGQELSDTPTKKTTTRVNKFGIRVKRDETGEAPTTGLDTLMNFNLDKAIAVGETVSFERVDPDNPKLKSSGTMKLESIDNGVAKLVGVVNVSTDGLEKPMKINVTSWMDVASAKANKIEATISGMPLGGPGGGSMTAKSASFSFTRKK